MKHKFDEFYSNKLNELKVDMSSKDTNWFVLEKKLNRKHNEKRILIWAFFGLIFIGMLFLSSILSSLNRDKILNKTVAIYSNHIKIEAEHEIELSGTKASPFYISWFNTINYSNNKINNTYNKNIIKSLLNPNLVFTSNKINQNYIKSKIGLKNRDQSDLHTQVNLLKSKSNLNKIFLKGHLPFTNGILEDTLLSFTSIKPFHDNQLDTLSFLYCPLRKIEDLNYLNLVLAFNKNNSENLIEKDDIQLHLRLLGGNQFLFKPNTLNSINSDNIYESIESPMNSKQFGLTIFGNGSERWRYGIGLQLNVTTMQVNHTVKINTNNLILEDQPINNIKKFAFIYQTTDKSVRSTINLSLFEVSPNQNLQHNDTFIMNMRFSRKIKQLRFPIWVERKIKSFEKINFYANVGSTILLASNIENKMVHQTENCKELCFINGIQPEINSQIINKFSLNSSIGMSIEYCFSQRAQLGVKPELIFGLDQFQAYPKNILSALGIYFNYKLN